VELLGKSNEGVFMSLGKLERVDLRDIWGHEASGFTSWLARDENLAELGQVMGMKLELVGQERDIEPFRADILCRDALTKNYVIIKSQLENTNHTHLGQILTYAAGLGARTVVWVAKQFNEEHRAALDWLNNISRDDFEFFALEIELWRIGESLAAPKFNVVSKPNKWQRVVIEASMTSVSEEEIQQRTRALQQANKVLENEKQTLANLSSTDRLTGLYNRYKFEDLFEFEKSQMLRHKTQLSIILLDIDFFKSVNDTDGHNVGDAVLKEFALILRASVRSSDVVVRWGGEEFIVFTPKTTLEQAQQLAETIRDNVKKAFFSHGRQLTASFGVTSFEDEDGLETLIQRADRALYRAKELGRDNVQIDRYNPELN
jgi:diguanylate cyclase (GGDEF)-like protein